MCSLQGPCQHREGEPRLGRMELQLLRRAEQRNQGNLRVERRDEIQVNHKESHQALNSTNLSSVYDFSSSTTTHHWVFNHSPHFDHSL